jgi:excisionase family DNA binding protein
MTDRLAYSIAEACAVAGIRKTRLYKEIRSGDLRAVKIGGRTVILADDLRRWLNGRPPIIPDQSESSGTAPEQSVIVHDGFKDVPPLDS